MNVATHIARIGFRRWYERQLIESHGYLVTAFLCMIACAATLESFLGGGPLGSRLAMAVGAFLAGSVGFLAWGRYRAIMERAEWLGDHATCRACEAYARFRIVGTQPRPAPPQGEAAVPFSADDAPLMGVECKRCGHRWTI